MDYLTYFKTKSDIIIDISNFSEIMAFNYIGALSCFKPNSIVKVTNLCNKTILNNKIGKIICKLSNDRYKILVDNKDYSISEKNINLYPIILYIDCERVNQDALIYYNQGFNVPLTDNKDILVIFYKGDYYYESKYKLKQLKLDYFFENASYDILVKCNICQEEKMDLISCDVCVNTFCHSCLLNFKKKQCPYCKADVVYKKIIK